MNKLSRLTLALVLSQAFTTAVLAVPVEKDAYIVENLKGNKALLNSMVKMINLYGYRCDSLSGVSPLTFSEGYEVVCNNYKYQYKIEDKGGNWVVTLD